MGARKGQGVVPDGGGTGLVDMDRQGFEQAEEGAHGGSGDPFLAFGLNQHIGGFPQPERGHMGFGCLQARQDRPARIAGFIGEAPGAAERHIQHQIARIRAFGRRCHGLP